MKKTISKICTIFFILASLLPLSWSMDIDQTEARSKQPVDVSVRSTHGAELVEAAPPPQQVLGKRLPLDFDQHDKYTSNVSNSPYRVSWELDVDFPNNDIRAVWIFRIEQEMPAGSDNWILTDEYIQNIQCDKHGKVQIQNGYAKFHQNGNGYITCETPNFNDVAEYMIEHLELGSISVSVHGGNVCTECLDPWMNASVILNGYPQNPQPIGYIKSNPTAAGTYTTFESNISRVDGAIRLSTNLTGWNTLEKSREFPTIGTHRFWTGMNIQRFLKTLETRQSNYPTKWTNYWSTVNGLPKDALLTAVTANDWFSWVEDALVKPTPTQDYEFSNGAHTFYIGHNPDTGEYFNGTMYNIGVDPGCIGH